MGTLIGAPLLDAGLVPSDALVAVSFNVACTQASITKMELRFELNKMWILAGSNVLKSLVSHRSPVDLL